MTRDEIVRACAVVRQAPDKREDEFEGDMQSAYILGKFVTICAFENALGITSEEVQMACSGEVLVSSNEGEAN